jgi:hypothetical protein
MQEEISYTEKEYDYALKCGVPRLGFIIEEKVRWPPDRMETEARFMKALIDFKQKVKRKPVSFWKSAEDLHGRVAIALGKQINTNPRTGWVPGSQMAAPEAMAELTRLSTENAALRERLQQALATREDKAKDERDKVILTLGRNKIRVNFWYRNASDWSDPVEVSLFEVFGLLAPQLMIEKSTTDAVSFLGVNLNRSGKPLRNTYPIPSNAVELWLADLGALGLVEPSSKKHLAKDTDQYWTLTQKGRQLSADLARARLGDDLDVLGTKISVNGPQIKNKDAPKATKKTVKPDTKLRPGK